MYINTNEPFVIPCTVRSLSHLIQIQVWRDFFSSKSCTLDVWDLNLLVVDQEGRGDLDSPHEGLQHTTNLSQYMYVLHWILATFFSAARQAFPLKNYKLLYIQPTPTNILIPWFWEYRIDCGGASLREKY